MHEKFNHQKICVVCSEKYTTTKDNVVYCPVCKDKYGQKRAEAATTRKPKKEECPANVPRSARWWCSTCRNNSIETAVSCVLCFKETLKEQGLLVRKPWNHKFQQTNKTQKKEVKETDDTA